MDYDKRHMQKLAHRLYNGVKEQVDEIVLNGPGDLDGPDRYIGNLNISFAYVEGESLLMGLKVSFQSVMLPQVQERHMTSLFSKYSYFLLSTIVSIPSNFDSVLDNHPLYILLDWGQLNSQLEHMPQSAAANIIEPSRTILNLWLKICKECCTHAHDGVLKAKSWNLISLAI